MNHNSNAETDPKIGGTLGHVRLEDAGRANPLMVKAL